MTTVLNHNMRFIRTDVTSVKLYEEYVIAATGSSLYVYKKNTLKIVSIYNQILKGQKIYEIEPTKDGSKLLIFGGKQFKVIERSNQEFQLFDFSPGSTESDDWLHSGAWLSDCEVVLLTAHNVVQIWDVSSEPVLTTTTIGKNNSILYSGLLVPLIDDVLVLSGTVFSEVIITRCKKEQPLHHLVGHKGVIFSISCCLQRLIIVTTSDDRSMRIWAINSSIENCESADYWDFVTISCVHELYGHSARVMRSCITNKYIISAGEDSCICFWDCKGTLLKRINSHQNAPIWSIDSDEEHLVTGGGDCAVTLHPLSTATGFSSSEILKLSEGNPKKLVFTARRNLVILKETGDLIYYNMTDKCETVWNLKHESTYIMLSISLCKQIIAIADMCGNLNVFIENCKGPANIAKVINTKLTIDKILSMDWAENRHLVLCSGSGEIYVVASRGNSVEVISKHCLPQCKERWLTSVAMSIDNNLLVVGDRCGNIHFYTKEDFNPMKTFSKVHGRYGPTSIRIKSDEIITTGRDGSLKYFSLISNNGVYRTKLTSSQEVGFPWVERCIDDDDNLICGFQERVFVVTDIRNNSKLIEVSCGGGHRSWDVVRYIDKINDRYEEMIKLIYLKNSEIIVTKFQLSKIVSKDIIKGTHSKEINCLKSHVTNFDECKALYITGGEDTTLRISSSLKDSEFQDEVILKHLSSIRTLKTCTNGNKLLVVSGGGRAQICIKAINVNKNNDKVKITVEELVDFLIKGTDKERKGDRTWRNCDVDFDPETRIMDLEIVEVDKNIYNIYTGCSDAFLRIFQFKYDESVTFKHLGQVKYHKTCILKTHCIKYLDQIIMVTCSTRGEICFWDVTVSTNEIENFLVLTTNKSGINCVASRVISDEQALIATGGDDNAVHVNLLDIQNKDFKTAKVSQHWTSDKFHCSQITGLLIIDDIFVSTSIDQRITVFKIKEDRTDLEFVNQLITDVADVQGMDLIKRSEDNIKVCVFGKGLEVLTIRLRN